jgi:thiol:disulfide interchange protein DsbA
MVVISKILKQWVQPVVKPILASLLLVGSVSMPVSVWASPDAPQENVDYRKLPTAQGTVADAGKIEVLEFFWYGCSHCYAFEPQLQSWTKKQAADVQLVKVPVAFAESEQPKQKTYYTLQALGKETQLHGKFFDGIHKDRVRLNDDSAIADFMEKQGIDKKTWQAAFTSFSVQIKAQRARKMAEAYKVDGVPMMAVNGKYLIEPGMTGGTDNMLKVVDFLVQKERELLASSKSDAKTKAQEPKKDAKKPAQKK